MRRLSDPSRCTPRGFTLIELLVVMAIIAVLAAFLFPVFAQARERARQVTCANNLKQIGMAITLYRDEYETYVPQEAGGLTWLEVNPGKGSLLDPYLKNMGVRQCPSRQVQEARYCINGWSGVHFGRPETSPAGVSDAQVPRPATTLIVWEHQINAEYCVRGQEGGASDTPDPAEQAHWDSSHHGGFMSLWCDGHVKRMTYATLRRTYFTVEEDPE